MFKNRLLSLPKSLWVALFCLVVQQLIVASSSIWITRLILHISEGSSALIWLWLYLASLILPYIPGAFALIEITKAQSDIAVNYVQKFAQLYPGRILEWTNRHEHDKKSSIIGGEAYPTLTSYIEYVYHLTSSTLNVALNLLALSIIVDISFLLTYTGGIVLAAIILQLQKHSKENLAINAQQTRIHWVSLLLKAWDNILLNNSYNLKIWNKRSSDSGLELITSSVRLERFSQFVSICMAFALILPSIGLVCYLAYTHINDLPYLAVLIVILPRLFQVLTYSYELLLLMADLPMQKAKLSTVLALLDPSHTQAESSTIFNRVDWGKIQSIKKDAENKVEKITPQELLKGLPSIGRITIHGENGSGKSSLLLSLKMKHGEQAFYLPYKHELLFSSEKKQVSSGQLSRHILEEIQSTIPAPIILLDEWDANLDKNNKAEISALIDKLACKCCVVEVLHPKL